MAETKAAVAQPAVKKGTPKTEMIIGTGVAKFASALKLLETSAETFKELPKTLEELSAQVADKQDKIVALEVEFGEKKRAAEVKFELELRANKEATVKQYLDSTERVAITTAEYANLKETIDILKKEQKNEIDKAVAIVTSSLKRDYEGAAKIAEATFATTAATDKAAISSLTSQIDTLKVELAAWKGALDNERAASVQRAQASSIGSVNIAPSK